MRRAIPEELADLLPDRAGGLSEAEVAERRARFGRNDIVEQPPHSGWQLLAETAHDPMLWFLLGTSLLFILLGDTSEALILLIAVLPLVGMDLYLHRRTAASTAGLSSCLASRARVVRGGREREVAVEELVPGDLVIVAKGDPFPADGILVKAEQVQVDESSLSGEAWPIHKRAVTDALISAQATTFESCHWGLAGTRLLTGSATMRIANTGRHTLYGEIVQSALAGAHARTPLQQAIAQLVIVLLIAATALCLLLALVRLQQGYGWVDALLSAVTLAVAALPEEFPVVFTFFLGAGVYRLARRKALVRRAVVVENIGRISAICSDKTGTITEGRLTLTHHAAAPGVAHEQLLQLAALAARGDSGDPLDAALLIHVPVPSRYTVQQTFPFTEDRKRETAIVRDEQGALFAVRKGAPETILALCGDGATVRSAALHETAAFAAGGHKVIACGWRPLEVESWPGGEPDRDFIFAGLLAFEDPVREGVAEAVNE
ncbi:MAG TPA: HAD-IC family P-type ATPase, partial [Gammaproteobacteria bacterium]